MTCRVQAQAEGGEADARLSAGAPRTGRCQESSSGIGLRGVLLIGLALTRPTLDLSLLALHLSLPSGLHGVAALLGEAGLVRPHAGAHGVPIADVVGAVLHGIGMAGPISRRRTTGGFGQDGNG